MRVVPFVFRRIRLIIILLVTCLFLIPWLVITISSRSILVPVCSLNDDLRSQGYALFEDSLFDDFPFEDGKQEIPRILHQTWKTSRISPELAENVRKSIRHNMHWVYYFWTDITARKLIENKHPILLELWDNCPERETVRRSDILRYVVLYEFGGVYADLDMLFLRPSDRLLTKYPCILTPEPYEHSALIYSAEYILSNAVMFCRPRHPFLKQLINELSRFGVSYSVLDATGPSFVTSQFMIYNNISSQNRSRRLDTSNPVKLVPKVIPPSFEARTQQKVDDTIYVANSQYFESSIDPTRYDGFCDICSENKSKSHITMRGCVTLISRYNVDPATNRFAFTDHQWAHSYFKSLLSFSQSVDIADVVPHRILYDG